jgi:hypothetical protein
MAEMRTLYFKGDEDTEWSPKILHAVDAVHALDADPDHWRIEPPAAEKVDEDESDEDDHVEGDDEQ